MLFFVVTLKKRERETDPVTPIVKKANYHRDRLRSRRFKTGGARNTLRAGCLGVVLNVWGK